MRMRRFLAFVLAVVMLMSNTVTASATSSSSAPEGENLNIVQNEDGSYTISPTEVEEEDDESTDEDLDNPSDEDEQEPDGDGAGDESGGDSGDESGDGPGDEGDNPNGGDNDDTNPGGDGGDIDNPNGEGEDGDDPLNPEEGEGEDTVSEEEQLPDENTVSENSASENSLAGPTMLLNETTESDIELAFGTGITGHSGESMYFTSLKDAVEEVDKIIEATPSLGKYNSANDVKFTINLPEVGESHEATNYAVVSDDLMVYNAHNNCTLNLNGNTLLVETSAKLNISIDGSCNDASITKSKVVVSAGDLQIFKPSVDSDIVADNRPTLRLSNLDIQMPSGTSKLILGDSSQKETLESVSRNIKFSECTITDSIDVDIYDTVEFLGTDTLNIRDLLIDLDEVEDTNFTEHVWFYQDLNAGKITSNVLWGIEDEHSLNVSELITNDSEVTTIFLTGPSNINTITANSDLEIRVIRGQGEVDGSISFGKDGTITKSKLETESASIRIYYSGEDDANGNFVEYIPKAGDNLISVAAGRTDIDTETFDYYEHTSGTRIFPEMKNNADGSYEIVRANALFSVYINGVSESFDSVDALKTRINKINNLSNTYYVKLLNSASVTENWDFSGLKAKSIILDLNGKTLTVEVDAYIKVNELTCGTITVANGKNFSLYANKNSEKYKGAYDNRLVVNNININFDTSLESNSGTFTIGELENGTLNVGYSDITLEYCDILGLENIDVVMNGSVAWNIQESAGYVASLSEKYKGIVSDYVETISPKSITVKNGGYGGVSGHDKAQFGFYVGADQFTLDGELDAFSLNVEDFVVKQGAEITVSSESEIRNLTIEEKENADLKCVYINLEKLHLEEDADIYSQGSITFSGDYIGVSGYGEMCIEKTTMPVAVDSGVDWAYELNSLTSKFGNTDTIVTVKTNDVNSGFLDTSNYQINTRSAGSSMSVWRKTVDAVNGTYELKAYSSANKIVVTETNSGDMATYDTLKEVKNYIIATSRALYEQGEEASGGNFVISLNKNVINVGNNDLDYEACLADSVELRMNNYSITYAATRTVSGNTTAVDPCICLDRINGNGSNAKINLPQNGTLRALPRSIKDDYFVKDTNYAKWDDVTLVANNGTSELVVGYRGWPEESFVEFGNVTFINSFKNIDLYGRVDINNKSDLKATGTITIDGGDLVYIAPDEAEPEAEGWYYRNQAYIAGPGKLSATSMEIVNNSRVSVYKLSLSGTLIGYVNGELVVLPGGSANLTNVELSGTGQEHEAFYIGFESEYTKGGETEITPIGTLKIAGKVTNNTNLTSPIFAYKNKCWDGDGAWYEYGNDEVIVTAPNSAVKASLFRIEGEGRCTKKIGSEISADTVSVRVHYNGHMDGDKWIESKEGLTYEYYSFQDAVANLAVDFDSRVGEYDFCFITDDELSANVTLPAFVQTAIMGTVEDGEEVERKDEQGNLVYDKDGNKIIDWIGNGFFQQFLNLKGKTITTSGQIYLDKGLRLNSDALDSKGNIIDGKIVSTYGECALGISEGQTLIMDENETPAPVLENVIVTAKNGGVNLYAVKDGVELWLDASFETRGFFIESGNWILNPEGNCYVKATDLHVSGEWVEKIYEEDEVVEERPRAASNLAVDSITLSNGGAGIGGRLEATDISVASCSLEVYEGASLSVTNDITLNNANMFAWPDTYTEVINNINMSAKSRLEVYSHLQAENITMDASKVFVADSGNLYVFDTLQILPKKAAYVGESVGDYTVENHGQTSVANVSMPVGTFANYNIVEAQTFSVKDYVGEDNAHLLCNTFKNTGAARFGYESNVLIHESGTVNNIYIYQYDGDDGQALLGRASGAEVTLTGSFTKENENQKLAAYVSDSFANFWGNEEPNQEKPEERQYAWDYIELWDEGNKIDANVEKLDSGYPLFKTTISAFPVDCIRVRPWHYMDAGKKTDNIDNAVFYDKDEKVLKVIGEYINIYAELPNYECSHLKSFTNWKDASAYLNALNSKTTTYIVEILEDIDIGQTLDLPSNVKQIIVRSGKGSWKSIDDDPAKTYWEPQKIKFSYQGGITLKTDTRFENILLDAYTLDKNKNRVEEYHGVLDTKGKTLVLDDVQLDFSDKEFSQVKGTSSTRIELLNGGNISAATKISGIGEIYMCNGAYLGVTNGLSVNNLIIDKIAEPGVNTAVSEVYIADQISFKASLEVKKLLEMNSQTSIRCDGTMKYVDIISNTEGNIFITPLSNGITITGSISSPKNMGMNYLKPVPVMIQNFWGQNEQVTGYALAGDGETTDYRVMKHAISISAGTRPDGITDPKTKLLTAEKVSPIWFVVEAADRVKTADAAIVYGDMVHKEGKSIISGLADPNNTDILLYAVFGENQIYLNSFGTLQDAFTEIDKIGGPDINFKIEMTADDDAIVKGKLGNYTFPSKAAEVQIVGNPSEQDQNRRITLNYNNALTLKSNVVLKDIELNPFTTNTISLGSYDAVLDNVILNDYLKTSINGSGTNKGSFLSIVSNTPVRISGDVTNVETFVIGGTEVQVNGKISAGTLVLPEDEVLTCLGTIAIGDVYTINGTIQTIPVYTWNKANTEITKVSSNLTISGDVLEMPSEDEGVEPQLTITFAEVNNGEITGVVDLEDENLNGLTGLIDADGAGVTIAKAVNVDTDAIVFGNALVELDENEEPLTIGTIYKKAGTLVYKCSDPVVLLQYVDNSGSEVETLCESFADAVTEINNLKTKRDYTMGIYGLAFNAGTLTMPNAKYVDTLTICPIDCVRAEIQYMNNITFTSNVVLENIDFVQIVKNGKYEDGSTKYEPVDEVKAEVGTYPSAVSVSVAGAYFVSIVNDLDKNLVNNKVTFNTPITLNGNKKAILNIGDGGALQTLDVVASSFEPWAEKTSLVQGKITGFAEMNVFSPISLYGYSSLNSKKEEIYNKTELSVTNLNVSDGATVVVGQDVVNNDDKVTITNLNLTDGTLETSGTGTFTNVVLGDGVDRLAVYGQTFNINGNLTSLTSDAELVTGLTKKSESALYVKGNVVLGNETTDVICVKVTEDGKVPYILGQTTAEDEKNSTLLLKAKTAPIDVFRPSTGEGESCVLEDNEYDPAAPEDGYILKKTGENIQVYYGSEIGVALCGPVAENGTIAEVINYYPTYNDAVTAIEALNVADAEYTIVVIQHVGTEGSPVALSMPSKAAKVTVVGYAGNAEKETIYYTNAPSLKTDMVFANVILAPEAVSKKVVSPAKLGITTGNFDITLQDIEVTGENAGIAKITGKNTATIKLDSEGLVINGDISAAKELIVAKNAKVTGSVTTDVTTVEAGKIVTVDSKFTAAKLNLNGTSVVDAQKAAVTITDITSVGENNKIVYGQDAKANPLLIIKGNVENASSPVTLDMKAAELKTLDTTTNPAKISLVKEAKWATVEKESLNKLNFALNGAAFNSSDYCWADKGVYRIPSGVFTPIQIKDAQDNVITYCLDFAQAVNYINTAADGLQDYVIDLTYGGRRSVDVNLTDSKAEGASAITMPGKDKAESVKVLGLNNGGTKIAFSGNVTTYGDVTFENIWLSNDNAGSFTIANKKDSNNDSSLTLVDTAVNGKAVIKSISGEKGITDITIRIEEGGIYPSESYGAVSNAELVDISNSAKVITFTGMSAVDNLTIAESKVQTTGKATVGTLNLQTNAAWEAKAAATVTEITGAKAGSYIGTFHSSDKKGVSTGLPQFTVTGTVTEPIQVKLFNTKITDANGEWLEIREAAGVEGFATLNATVKYTENYANQKLVLAKAESADKFIAAEYCADWTIEKGSYDFNDESIKAYKDKNGYVSNGDISVMEVLLSELDGNGAEINTTYVATYAEAIQVINNLNNKDAAYKISLRNTTLEGAENGNEGVIKTALSGTKAAYGTLALPAAKKAAAITVEGASDNMVMEYTSGLKPNCDVTFKNITLTEGSLDKKGNYKALNYITPNLDADVTITFGEGVKIVGASDGNLVFNTISGKKGELAFADTYTIGAIGKITLPKLDIAAGKKLAVMSEKAIAITNITGGDNTELSFKTYFTNKAWKKAATQLSITGDVLLGNGSVINVDPYIYDATAKTYNLISEEQMNELMVSSSVTPASWQKVITAPKMQTMNGNITLCSDGVIEPIKYNGGIYFTNEELPVVLHGGEPEVVPDGEGGYNVNYEDDYVAHFLSWEEAIKEIDRINVKKIYTIELHGDIGTETPIKTLTMPSKASGLIVLGISDANNESPDIMMTGTTVTAKCNLAFDNVGITAVKKTGNNYYSVPFTLNTGNYEVEIENMPDMCRFFVYGEDGPRSEYDSEMKVTGSAKGSFTYTPCEAWYDVNDAEFEPKTETINEVEVTSIIGGPGNYVDVIFQISKVGNVILNKGSIVVADWDENGNLVDGPDYASYYDTNYYIPNGISGVNSFMITPDVRVDCAKTDFTVKDLMMGDTADEYDENDILIENADERSGLSARNITVSGLLTIASSDMHAGTSAVGDGKVTLTNVIFRDNHNHIEGKQDKNGNSLIQIKGTVGAYNANVRSCDSAVTIGLFYNNSSQNYVRVSEGMNLLTAPKAESSWFRPNYGYVDNRGTVENKNDDIYYENMGWEIGVDITPRNELGVPRLTGEGAEATAVTEFVPTYGLFKSGNGIKYGMIREAYQYDYTYKYGEAEGDVKEFRGLWDVREIAEARLWIGTNTPAQEIGNAAYLDFKTFEEAVKAIDSMGLKAADGKTNLNYCIELLRTVEIGNTAGNGKYSALTLPSKASEVTICGNENSILFTGNVTLKCNTEFWDVKLSPVKLVKGEVVPAEVNLAAGNFELTWSPRSRVVYAYEYNGEWCYDEGYAENQIVGYTFANVTGSSKGKLVLTEDSELSANNVTGFGEIIFEGDGLEDDGYSWIYTKNNASATKVTYKQGAEAKLRVCGNLTVTSVELEDDVDAQFRVFTGKTLKVNGTTLKDENGVKYNESVDNGGTNETLQLYLYDQTGKYAAGTKLVTGKYLDASEWTVYTTDEEPYTHYVDDVGTGLYLGKVAAVG